MMCTSTDLCQMQAFLLETQAYRTCSRHCLRAATQKTALWAEGPSVQGTSQPLPTSAAVASCCFLQTEEWSALLDGGCCLAPPLR